MLKRTRESAMDLFERCKKIKPCGKNSKDASEDESSKNPDMLLVKIDGDISGISNNNMLCF